KAETKLAKLLKPIDKPKKQTENKPENKAGHLIENKRPAENKPETNRRTMPTLAADSCARRRPGSRGYIPLPPACDRFPGPPLHNLARFPSSGGSQLLSRHRCFLPGMDLPTGIPPVAPAAHPRKLRREIAFLSMNPSSLMKAGMTLCP
ncbi:MAG: hypothetical protein P8Z30_10380, partial [Acidobacteriota bacterium]